MSEYEVYSPKKVTLGDAVRSFRSCADLTQDELAEKAGVSTQVLSEIEDGKMSPPSGVLDSIAEALGYGPEIFEVCYRVKEEKSHE